MPPYEGEKRGRAVGIWAAAGAAAAAVAPLIGGWLVDNVGWPAIFYINIPLGLGAILLALMFVTESSDASAGQAPIMEERSSPPPGSAERPMD